MSGSQSSHGTVEPTGVSQATSSGVGDGGRVLSVPGAAPPVGTTPVTSAQPTFLTSNPASASAAAPHASPLVSTPAPGSASRLLQGTAANQVPSEPTAAVTEKRPKKRRVPLSNSQKKRLCEISRSEPMFSHQKVADAYFQETSVQVERSTVSRALLKSSMYLEYPLQAPKEKHKGTVRYPRIEESVRELIRHYSVDRLARRTLTDEKLSSFAKTAAKTFGDTEFKASQSWLEAMKRRANLVTEVDGCPSSAAKWNAVDGRRRYAVGMKKPDFIDGDRAEALCDIWPTEMIMDRDLEAEFERLDDVFSLEATEFYYDVGPEDVDWNHAEGEGAPVGAESHQSALPSTSNRMSVDWLTAGCSPSAGRQTGQAQQSGGEAPSQHATLELHRLRQVVGEGQRHVSEIDRVGLNDDGAAGLTGDTLTRAELGAITNNNSGSVRFGIDAQGNTGSGDDQDDDDDDDDDDDEVDEGNTVSQSGGQSVRDLPGERLGSAIPARREDADVDLDLLDPGALNRALLASFLPPVGTSNVGQTEQVERDLHGVEALLGAAQVESGPYDHEIAASIHQEEGAGRNGGASGPSMGSVPLSSSGQQSTAEGEGFSVGLPPVVAAPFDAVNADSASAAAGRSTIFGGMDKESSSFSRNRGMATVMLCVNASGKKRVPPWIVGDRGISGPRDDQYRPFPGISARYVAKQKPWLTGKVVRDWLEWFDSTITEEDRLVLVVTSLVTRADAMSLSLKHVVVIPAPMQRVLKSVRRPGQASAARDHSFCTPMDKSLLESFRGHYRLLYLKSIVGHIHARRCIPKLSMRDVADMATQAWGNIPERAVRSSFRRSTILPKKLRMRWEKPSSRSHTTQGDDGMEGLAVEVTKQLDEYRELVPLYGFRHELGLNGPKLPTTRGFSNVRRWFSLPGEAGDVLHPRAPTEDIMRSVLDAIEDGSEDGAGFVRSRVVNEGGERAEGGRNAEGKLVVDQLEISSVEEALIVMKKIEEFYRRPECNNLRNEEVDYNTSALVVALEKEVREGSKLAADGAEKGTGNRSNAEESAPRVAAAASGSRG